MTPIAIKLDDFWTKERLTRLDWGNGWLTGCGISFDVWHHLLRFEDGTWFAGVFGAYEDNFVAASIVPERHPAGRKPFRLTPRALEEGNVSRETETCGLGELTAEALERAGFAALAQVEINESVTACLFLHDDFMFSLAMRQPDLLQAALAVIVRVHAHYLGKELPAMVEKRVMREARALLEAGKQIKLHSDPVTGQMLIRHERPPERWLDKLLGRPGPQFEVVIDVHESASGS